MNDDGDFAKQVIRSEAQALQALSERVDEIVAPAITMIEKTQGRVVTTGLGKAGLVAQKIAATMSSTGTRAIWMHATEAFHGDLGMVDAQDVVLALSNSGESEELTRLLPYLKNIGAGLIAITGNKESALAKHSDVLLDYGQVVEACPLGLAPSTSTTVMMALGDALALTLSHRQGFKLEDFARYHPGGKLGKQLMKVESVMRSPEDIPLLPSDVLLHEVLKEITTKRTGAALFVDQDQHLIGLFTDGDLRRALQHTPDLLNRPASEVMINKPQTIEQGHLATEAMKIMREHRVNQLPVVDQNESPVGLIDIQDLLDAGIV